MPAMTLGLAEVEERLRALRRRLNGVTLLHAISLSVSTLAATVAALIVLGLRGSASTFGAAMWGGLAACVVVTAGCVIFAHRRWLDINAAARLADRRGQLTDRLTTLLDLRQRPRPARLAPVLVAQTLALGNQWQAERIAPRRVPRSAFLLIAALLALAASPLVAPEPPPPAQAASAVAGGTAGPDGTEPLQAIAMRGDGVDGTLAQQTGAAPPGAGRSAPASLPDASDQQASAGDQSAQAPQPEALLGLLPDKLRQAILSAFHAPQPGTDEALAKRPGDGTGGGEDHAQEQGAQRSKKNGGSGEDEAKDGAAQGKSTAQRQPGQGKPGEQVAQQQDGNAANDKFDGNSPAAGNGSSPGGLMDPKGTGGTANADGPKTFKLTITSFLHAVEQKGNQPPHPIKPGTGGAPTTSGSQVALNERQLHDDALRKAEIPAEYEDIVRRVYSLRRASQ